MKTKILTGKYNKNLFQYKKIIAFFNQTIDSNLLKKLKKMKKMC